MTMDQEEHLLITDDDSSDDELESQFEIDSVGHRRITVGLSWLRHHRSKTQMGWYLYVLTIHLLLVLFPIILSRNRIAISTQGQLHRGSYSPALDVIEYELQQKHATDHHKHSAYSGPPSSVTDEAWDTLVRPVFFNASKEELIQAGESWEDAADLIGGGYLASLGVYHELHCLRQLRLFLYQKTYYPHLTKGQDDYLHGHLDHCIETIRLSLMCVADTSVYTFKWHDPPREKPATKSNAKRTCVKWDPLEDWSYSRSVAKAPRLISPISSDEGPRAEAE